MRVLGLDLETTGIDVAQNQIIEIGAAVWDVERGKPTALLSELIKIDENIPEEVTKITGITNEDVREWGKPLPEVLAELKSMADRCEYVVAHNGRNFDKIVLDRHLLEYEEYRFTTPWIDTMTDLPFPEDMRNRKLTYLAADHDFLNPFSHRAVFDVLTMLKVFARYPLQEIQELQRSPLVRVVADVKFEERDKARQNGFRWDRDARQWFMEIKQIQLDKMSFPFNINTELP